MTDAKNALDLEGALEERARCLAEEYRAHGRESRSAILRENRQRLRAREERISQDATANAERLFRRRVQAAELRLQGDLDRQRWGLIQSVIDALRARLAALIEEKGDYEQLLQSLLARAYESIGQTDVVAAFSVRDLAWLQNDWDAFCAKAVPGGVVRLDPVPCKCTGGVRVSSGDERIRVDSTFEARMERYRDELTCTIAERLFAHEASRLS